MNVNSLIVWLLICLSFSVKAQNYRATLLSTEEGLSQGSVYAMHKDTRGYVWIGTQDGLNRYDGTQVEVYRQKTGQKGSIRGCFVNRIVESPDGKLWIGTEDCLNLYDRNTNTFSQIFATNSEGKDETGHIMPFLATNRVLWYWSGKEGIIKYNHASKSKTTVFTDFSFSITHFVNQHDLFFDKQGQLWLKANSGVVCFDTLSRQARYYFSDDLRNEVGKPTTFIKVVMDQSGMLWFGTQNGLIRFNPHNQQYKVFLEANGCRLDDVHNIIQTPDGMLWIATQSAGLLRFNPQTAYFQEVKYHPPSVPPLTPAYFLFTLGDGIVWVHIEPIGLLKLIPKGKNFLTVNYNSHRALESNSIRCLVEHDQKIWVGTTVHGLYVYNPSTDKIEKNVYLPTLPSETIWCFHRDEQHTIWLGTGKGLVGFDKRKNRFQTFTNVLHRNDRALNANFIKHIGSASENQLLIATESGVYLFDKQKHNFQEIRAFEKQTIEFAVRLKGGKVMVSVENKGVHIGKLINDNWQEERHLLPQNHVLSLLEQSGRWWLGCADGLVKVDIGKNYQWRKYDERDGMANSHVYGLLMDTKGYFWMSTNRGILRFDSQQDKFLHFKPMDGLQGNEYNRNAYVSTSTGMMYFGGANGFNYFDPNEIALNQYYPEVRCWKMSFANEKSTTIYLDKQTELALKADQNSFSIEYAALDYVSNGQNTYQYRLKGLDNRWSQVHQQTTAQFVQVPAGKYTFEVKAANSDGVWNPVPTTLQIEIAPQLWETIGFRATMLLLLLVGIYGFYRYRLYGIVQQQRRELAVMVQTQEAERMRFGQDLHDGLGANLSAMKMVLGLLNDPASLPIKAKTEYLLNESIDDLRQLIHAMSPRSLERLGLLKAVQELAIIINQTGKVQVAIESDNFPENLPEEMQVNWYRIVQELFQNALKHAQANQIILKLSQNAHSLALCYTDDGRGLDTSVISATGNGLSNLHTRTQLLNGKLDIKSVVGGGTTISIEIPF